MKRPLDGMRILIKEVMVICQFNVTQVNVALDSVVQEPIQSPEFLARAAKPAVASPQESEISVIPTLFPLFWRNRMTNRTTLSFPTLEVCQSHWSKR